MISLFSCTSSIEPYQTGNIEIIVPKSSILDGIPYAQLEIGLYPIGSDLRKESAIEIVKLYQGKVKFSGIVPGTYITAVALNADYNQTRKTVQVVGGKTKTYNLY